MPTSTPKARQAEAVAHGVDLLNEQVPGWVERIDLDRLEFDSIARCSANSIAAWDQKAGPRTRPNQAAWVKAIRARQEVS